ncbi:hypothetical protein MMC21_003238, partial [Puttea exsequens]|nr:hypothetical protein [Puttea exsequens]
ATTNTDQDFFLHPSHGALSHNAPVTIYYNAAQNPFINIPGITFNRDVYLNTPLVRDYGTQNWQDFGALVQLLIHEFTHVEQYAATGYDLVSYGHSYVYQWCRAGFKYSSIDYEQAAKAREPEVNALLIFGAPGNAYFWIWKFASLLPTLGNPIARTPSVPTTGEAGSELPFELGVLQILDLAANPPQFRVFTNAQIAARAAAQCSTTPDPVCTDLKPKPRLRGRSPTPMQKDGPIIKCTPGDKKAQAKQCRDAKAAWAAAQKDAPWRSDVTVPKPAAPAPAPPVKPVKAGCPPDCEIVTLVPATSKSCRFDEPPPGCDRAWAEENNRVCRAKMGQC